MSRSLDVLVIMSSIAIYKKRGLIHALAYLIAYGYTLDEATDLIALYDDYEMLAEHKLL